MINLQLLMSQRQTTLQLATDLLTAMNDPTSTIAKTLDLDGSTWITITAGLEATQQGATGGTCRKLC